MKIKNWVKLMKYFIVLLVVGLSFFSACNRINALLELENDNKFEQALEDIIERETGIDVDLSN